MSEVRLVERGNCVVAESAIPKREARSATLVGEALLLCGLGRIVGVRGAMWLLERLRLAEIGVLLVHSPGC